MRRVIILFISIMLLIVAEVNASIEPTNQLIVSGKLINSRSGSAVTQHKVYISIPGIEREDKKYSKEVYTDDEGFYVDTILTNLTKGKLNVYTLDKDLKSVDSTVNFRFFRNTSISLLVNLHVNMPYHSDIVKARFKYVQKQGGSKYYFRFFDLTKFDKIVARKWSFGDGSYSNEKNPDHTYQTPGLYRVKLIVEATFSGTNTVISYSQMILVPEKMYFHIGGQVFIDHFPIDIGKAFLYFKDSADSFIPVDTVTFDTLGYYIFYNLPEGEYIIKAQPCELSEYYGEMCPTYFGNTLKWQQADICKVVETCWDYDISLLSSESMISGEGAIKGNVFVVDNGLKRFGLGSGENITIYLLNKEKQSITYLYTDYNGSFNFNDLTMGNYKLYPEVTGVNTSVVPIVINEDNPVVDDVVIELSLEGVSYILPEKTINPDLINTIFPNPISSTDNITVSVSLKRSQSITLSVNDFLGSEIYKKQVSLSAGVNKISLSSEYFSNGVYLVTVTDEQGNTGVRKLVIDK